LFSGRHTEAARDGRWQDAGVKKRRYLTPGLIRRQTTEDSLRPIRPTARRENKIKFNETSSSNEIRDYSA